VRSRSAEDALSKWLGRSEPLKSLWVRITDDLEYPEIGQRASRTCRDSEEGRECGEIWHFIPFRESVGRQNGQRNGSIDMGAECIPWEIYHLEKCGEIRGRVRGQNTRTTVG
jgi:hypothetical protein